MFLFVVWGYSGKGEGKGERYLGQQKAASLRECCDAIRTNRIAGECTVMRGTSLDLDTGMVVEFDWFMSCLFLSIAHPLEDIPGPLWNQILTLIHVRSFSET